MRNNAAREYVRELKQKSHCATCPESDWRVLEFHHRDPAQKKSSVSELVQRNASMEKLLFEISLCIILCANCHKKIHSFGIQREKQNMTAGHDHMKRWHGGAPRPWAELHGREAALLIFPDKSRAYSREKGQGGPILCSVENIAGETFVSMVEHDAEGHEICRHSVAHIESIVWLVDEIQHDG